MVGDLYARCRVYTPLRVERRRDHGGLGPKSKREKETERDPITQRTDYDRGPMVAQGHGPTNTENANRKRHRWEQQRICT